MTLTFTLFQYFFFQYTFFQSVVRIEDYNDAMEDYNDADFIYNAVILNNLQHLMQIYDEIGEEKFREAINTNSAHHLATPLIMAVRKGYEHITKYLLDNGADTKLTGVVLFDGETICEFYF